MFVSMVFQFLNHLDDLVEELCRGGMELSRLHQICVRSTLHAYYRVFFSIAPAAFRANP